MDFDQISLDDLRRSGSWKWSRYPGAIGAFVAEMDFGVAPPVSRALHEAVDAGRFGYLPQHLVDSLGEAAAQWLKTRYDWSVAPQDVRPVPDVRHGLETVVRFFTRPASPVILPTPAYMPFLNLPHSANREVVQVPMAEVDGRPAYDLGALDAAFRAGGHLLVLVNPHNPIGRVLERAELQAISEVVERHGGRVFADEIHGSLVYDDRRHVPYASISSTTAGHTITATSASKAFNLPGLQCGQLVLSNDADRETWSRMGDLGELGTSILGVTANIAAYTEGGPWLDEVLTYLHGNRAELGRLVGDLMPGVAHRRPEGTYLGWLDFRSSGLPTDPGAYFLEHANVAVTNGAACGEAGTGFARLNFALPRPVLREMVERMAAALP